jgi:hypothetical protein
LGPGDRTEWNPNSSAAAANRSGRIERSVWGEDSKLLQRSLTGSYVGARCSGAGQGQDWPSYDAERRASRVVLSARDLMVDDPDAERLGGPHDIHQDAPSAGGDEDPQCRADSGREGVLTTGEDLARLRSGNWRDDTAVTALSTETPWYAPALD